MALGWRWLADNSRWPGHRKGLKYGWMFRDHSRMIQLRHILPWGVNDFMPSTPNDLVPLMQTTANSIGRWIKAGMPDLTGRRHYL